MPNVPRADYFRRPVAPCKDCTTRFASCHSSCSSYKQWKEEIKEQRKQAFFHTHSERVLEDYNIKEKQKNMNPNRRKRRCLNG
jgi:hypothetical protein